MRPFLSVCIGLLSLLPGGLLAQADSERTLSVGAGISRTANRDYITSPLIYVGNLPTLQLAYSHRSPANRHLVSLAVATGGLTSAASPLFRAANSRGVLTYGYARRLGRSPVFVGALAEALLNYGNYGINRINISFAAAYTANLLAVAEWPVGRRGRFVAQAHLPLAGYVARNPYAGYDQPSMENFDKPLKLITTGRWAFIDQFFSATGQVSYHHQLSNRLGASATYRFGYNRFAQPRTLTMLSHDLLGGLTYHF